MNNVIIYSQDQMWEAIKKLAKVDDEKAAAEVLKATIEKSFRYVGVYTPIISTLTFAMPNELMLKKLQEVDREMLIAYDEKGIEKSYEYLIDYIDLLSQITPKNSQLIRKKLLASILIKGKPRRRYSLNSDLARKSISATDVFVEEETRDFYTPKEAAKKLGLSDQTIRRMCEQGKFEDAYQTPGGHWRIPDTNFITSREQDRRAEKILDNIDRKNSKAGDVDEFDL
ncbi:helix-turn-helix domain-containing protein [Scopulibacillus cellulosilyticus]|uniref:Helix-turn-helix domain-containing protein n=1 Tax=Scopulibacillus cellulosilyticus TaxID=2665665 RepID=A0ABW2Q1Z4_9BACL